MEAARTALKQSMEETLQAEKEVSGLQLELHDSHVQVRRKKRRRRKRRHVIADA
jgi:hypothetical protein